MRATNRSNRSPRDADLSAGAAPPARLATPRLSTRAKRLWPRCWRSTAATPTPWPARRRRALRSEHGLQDYARKRLPLPYWPTSRLRQLPDPLLRPETARADAVVRRHAGPRMLWRHPYGPVDPRLRRAAAGAAQATRLNARQQDPAVVLPRRSATEPNLRTRRATLRDMSRVDCLSLFHSVFVWLGNARRLQRQARRPDTRRSATQTRQRGNPGGFAFWKPPTPPRNRAMSPRPPPQRRKSWLALSEKTARPTTSASARSRAAAARAPDRSFFRSPAPRSRLDNRDPRRDPPHHRRRCRTRQRPTAGIVGPCSIPRPARRAGLRAPAEGGASRHAGDLEIVIEGVSKSAHDGRLEGVINDLPRREYRIHEGLRIARQLLVDINRSRRSGRHEFLDVISRSTSAT